MIFMEEEKFTDLPEKENPDARKNETPASTTKNATNKKSAPLKKNGNADFKRRYFDYYDDIKISDRQDW